MINSDPSRGDSYTCNAQRSWTDVQGEGRSVDQGVAVRRVAPATPVINGRPFEPAEIGLVDEAVEGGHALFPAGLERVHIEAADLRVGDLLHGLKSERATLVKHLARSDFMVEVHGTSPDCPARETTTLLLPDEFVCVSRVFREGEPIRR
jgi:hypothetical protein